MGLDAILVINYCIRQCGDTCPDKDDPSNKVLRDKTTVGPEGERKPLNTTTAYTSFLQTLDWRALSSVLFWASDESSGGCTLHPK